MNRLYRISDYEWELLESNRALGGATIHGWYEIFLATNDVDYLERLLAFWRPPAGDSRLLGVYSRADFQSGDVNLPTDTRLLHAVAQHPESLFDLSWRQFEKFAAELLLHLGYEDVRLGAGARDGGIDVSACLSHPLGVERVIVQCKRHRTSRPVGSPTITQLLGTTLANNASKGIVVTTSSLTRPAELLVKAHEHRLHALGWDELRRLLQGLAEPDQSAG